MKLTTKTLLLTLVSLLFFAGCNNTDNAGDRPNVVIIFIDDMGYGDLSCTGNTLVETPNMDMLAEDGIRFSNFYVNSPICSPSRVALNTGMYPMRFAIHSYISGSEQNRERAMADYLNPGALTLARVLQENGYATAHFGKWHLGGGRDLGDVPHPTEYGFDKSLVSFEGIGDRVLFPGDRLCEQSALLGRGNIIWAPKHRSTSIYVDSALAFVRKQRDEPFYLHLFPNDVHDPHLPDSAVLEKYKSVTANPWEQKFLAVVEELDRQIGRFTKGLDDLGVLDHTIVVFTSDNGPTDWPHYYDRSRYPEDYEGELYAPGFTGGFYGRKWSLYEGGIRMPFMVMWKDRIAGATEDHTTVMSAIDLFPSLLSLLEIDVPEGLDGRDKSRALLGEPMLKSDPVMWEYSSNPGGSIAPGNPQFRSPNLAIRQDNMKLLINTDSSEVMMFDLDKDPYEQENLAEENPELAGELAGKVLRWRRSMPVAIPGGIPGADEQ